MKGDKVREEVEEGVGRGVRERQREGVVGKEKGGKGGV